MTLETQAKNFSREARAAVKEAEPNNDTKVKGDPAAKKESKRPAQKVAPAKAAKPESSERRSAFANDAVITVLKTEHAFKGKRGAAIDALKTGLTVEQFKTLLAKKDMKENAIPALVRALDLKMISIKG